MTALRLLIISGLLFCNCIRQSQARIILWRKLLLEALSCTRVFPNQEVVHSNDKFEISLHCVMRSPRASPFLFFFLPFFSFRFFLIANLTEKGWNRCISPYRLQFWIYEYQPVNQHSLCCNPPIQKVTSK